jgi:hypothetical protein
MMTKGSPKNLWIRIWIVKDSTQSLPCGMDKDITFWLCHSGVLGAAGCLIRIRRSAGLFCKIYLALSSG